MIPAREYHIAVRLDGETPRVSIMLSRSARSDLPTSRLIFQPAGADAGCPVTIYWKSPIADSESSQIAAEHAVLAYCARLHQETPYEGPVDCCL